MKKTSFITILLGVLVLGGDGVRGEKEINGYMSSVYQLLKDNDLEQDVKVCGVVYDFGDFYNQNQARTKMMEKYRRSIKMDKPLSEDTINPKYVKDIFLAIEPEKEVLIDTDLSKHITKMVHISGSKIEAMIKTSIQLVNYAWPLDDYCCFTHSILRALEGLIRKRLMEDSIDTFDNIGEFFQDKDNMFKFKDEITRFDDIPALKNSLEEAYDFYNKNRHAISHVDKANIEASKMMNYDDAVDVINECLKRINRLCNNWN